ncbi:hypothetical protein IKF86_01490 [Candidatus Saccharibacteria bacterium]|nr:hypothetical protein [Candidatus Saccharibacteria bacterium]
MDYKGNGNNFQNDSDEVFFTPGNGDSAPEVNDSGASVNTDIFSIDRDPKNIGQSAIFSTEGYDSADSLSAPNHEGAPEIISSEPQDFAPLANQTREVSEVQSVAIAPSIQPLSQDSPTSVAKQIISDFRGTGQTSVFYDAIRGEGGLVDASTRKTTHLAEEK